MNETKKTNFFAIPVFSFIPDKYKELVRNSAGKLFGVLFVVFLLLGIIQAIDVVTSLNDTYEELKYECPDFSIVNGEFYCEKPIMLEEEQSYILIDDSIYDISENDIKDLISKGYYGQIMIIGREEIGMFNQGRIQVVSFSALGLTTLTKDMLFDNILKSFNPIIGGVVVIWRLLCLLGYYFATLIMSLFTMIFVSVMNKNLDYQKTFRITLLGKLPVYILLFVFELFVSVPISVHLLIGALLIMLFTGVVVYNYPSDDQSLNQYHVNM